MTRTAKSRPARLLLDPNLDPATAGEVLQGLRLVNGTRKTTWPNRFVELDADVVEFLRAGEDVVSDLRVLDVAVSSGISTIELVEVLSRSGFDVDMTATDMLTTAQLVTLAPGVRLLVDGDDNPIQWDLGIRTLRAHPYGNSTDRLRAVLARLWGALKNRRLHRCEVMLTDPRLSRIARVVSEDLIDPDPELDGPYDLVRACNILNDDYFDADVLDRMCTTLIRRVDDGGYLVVVRTLNDGSSYGTIFKRVGPSLDVVKVLTRPCDVHERCLSLAPDLLS